MGWVGVYSCSPTQPKFFNKDNSVSTFSAFRFKKSSASKLAKAQNKDAIQSMKAIIKKIESGQFYVDTFGGWPGGEGKFNFSITLKEAEIPRLSEELEK